MSSQLVSSYKALHDEMQQDKVKLQIAELEKKVAVERKVKSGAEAMKSMLKDKNALQEIETAIRESQKRLDFLNGEMAKLVKKQRQAAVAAGGAVAASESNDANDEEESNAAVPEMKQQHRTSGLWSKLGLGGSQTSQGSLPTKTSTTSKSQSSLAGTLTRRESVMHERASNLTPEMIDSKVKQFKEKLELEQRVKVGAETLAQSFFGKGKLSSSDAASRDEAEKKAKDATSRIALLKTALQRYQAMHVEGLAKLDENEQEVKKPIGGRIKITVVQAKNLVGKKSSKNDAYVAIRVDNVMCARTKLKPKQVWNETLDVSIAKGQEIEFSIYDSEDNLMSILFFKLPELESEVKKLHEQLGQVADDGVEHTWDMEPTGQIQMKILFSAHARKNNAVGKQLKRAQNIRRKKQIVVNGHKFQSTQFYGFMTCALCSEYLIAGSGYQCECCEYVAHKKCFEKVVTRCITKPEEADEINAEMSKNLRHDVPHRWEMAGSLTPAWCAHCGYILPVSTKKSYEKCNDCQICVHSDCKLYIPNLCGMTMETANKMLAQMMEIEKVKAVKQKAEHAKENARVIGAAKTGVVAVNAQAPVAVRAPSLDDFIFIAVLGKGNFGKVMLAEEKVSKQLYAIKVLKKEFILQNDEIESTRSEKRVFQAINRGRHPFLVGLHSCFQTETRIYFVMEYVSGGDLMLHIQRQQFTEKRARYYACEVLLALEYFHQNDIVYRDLKLDNILLTLDGHIKVADYGLCKEQLGFGGLTNTFCGTPEFMAPEILLEQQYGRAIDWWAFGVLIFEMLLGQSPFKGQDEEEIFAAIIDDDVAFPANMAKDAASIVQALLIKDPLKRLGSSKADSEDIKAHPYFNGVVWEDVMSKKHPPPFTPAIKHEKDVSNFDEEFTREMPVLTPIQNQLAEADQAEFAGFSYVAEWLTQYQAQAAALQAPPATAVEPEGPPPAPKSNKPMGAPAGDTNDGQFFAPPPPSSEPPVADFFAAPPPPSTNPEAEILAAMERTSLQASQKSLDKIDEMTKPVQSTKQSVKSLAKDAVAAVVGSVNAPQQTVAPETAVQEAAPQNDKAVSTQSMNKLVSQHASMKSASNKGSSESMSSEIERAMAEAQAAALAEEMAQAMQMGSQSSIKPS